jgi:hypothetical protein
VAATRTARAGLWPSMASAAPAAIVHLHHLLSAGFARVTKVKSFVHFLEPAG